MGILPACGLTRFVKEQTKNLLGWEVFRLSFLLLTMQVYEENETSQPYFAE